MILPLQIVLQCFMHENKQEEICENICQNMGKFKDHLFQQSSDYLKKILYKFVFI